jgi:hypothetical protein
MRWRVAGPVAGEEDHGAALAQPESVFVIAVVRLPGHCTASFLAYNPSSGRTSGESRSDQLGLGRWFVDGASVTLTFQIWNFVVVILRFIPVPQRSISTLLWVSLKLALRSTAKS